MPTVRMSAQVIVVVWQIGVYAAADAEAGITTGFWEVYGFVTEGALVPVIVRHASSSPVHRSTTVADSMRPQAIYPTTIVILAALNRSQIECGFRRKHEDGEGGPGPARMLLRTLTVTIGSVAGGQ